VRLIGALLTTQTEVPSRELVDNVPMTEHPVPVTMIGVTPRPGWSLQHRLIFDVGPGRGGSAQHAADHKL
jgi:hypothetical protein